MSIYSGYFKNSIFKHGNSIHFAKKTQHIYFLPPVFRSNDVNMAVLVIQNVMCIHVTDRVNKL